MLAALGSACLRIFVQGIVFRAEIGTKWLPEARCRASFFDVVFCLIFGWLLVHFGLQEMLKNLQKSHFFRSPSGNWRHFCAFGRRGRNLKKKLGLLWEIMVLPRQNHSFWICACLFRHFFETCKSQQAKGDSAKNTGKNAGRENRYFFQKIWLYKITTYDLER